MKTSQIGLAHSPIHFFCKALFWCEKSLFMPVCTKIMQKQWVLCSHINLQYKTCQINLTASKLSKNNYPNVLHTFKEYVTIIDFLARPGPNVPYVVHLFETEIQSIIMAYLRFSFCKKESKNFAYICICWRLGSDSKTTKLKHTHKTYQSIFKTMINICLDFGVLPIV